MTCVSERLDSACFNRRNFYNMISCTSFSVHSGVGEYTFCNFSVFYFFEKQKRCVYLSVQQSSNFVFVVDFFFFFVNKPYCLFTNQTRNGKLNARVRQIFFLLFIVNKKGGGGSGYNVKRGLLLNVALQWNNRNQFFFFFFNLSIPLKKTVNLV